MDNNSLVEGMKQYLSNCKKEAEINKDTAKEKAKKNLIEMGYMNEESEILPPYNGQKVNDEDFTYGPSEFQYVKTNKK